MVVTCSAVSGGERRGEGWRDSPKWHIVHGWWMVLSKSVFAGTVWSNVKVSGASAGDKTRAGAEGVSLIILFVSIANGQEARRPELEIRLLYFSLTFSKYDLNWDAMWSVHCYNYYLSLFCRWQKESWNLEGQIQQWQKRTKKSTSREWLSGEWNEEWFSKQRPWSVASTK